MQQFVPRVSVYFVCMYLKQYYGFNKTKKTPLMVEESSSMEEMTLII